MKRKDMLRDVSKIVSEACNKALAKSNEPYVEAAAERVVKVFEKALKDSIDEAVGKIPGLGKLFEKAMKG